MPGKPKPKRKGAAVAVGARTRRQPARKPAAGPRRVRSSTADARREAILTAALDIFSRHGFAATRLEDVAAGAGIAKGTLYLYFSNKQALFEELIRSRVTPLFDTLESAAVAPGMPAAAVIGHFFDMFRKEVLGTERKLILHLLISEGARFPAIAEFYHREVVSRGVRLLRRILRRAVARGELPASLHDYPQLIVAPLIMSVIWDNLFGRLDPLDIEGLLQAHARILASAGKAAP